MINHIKKHFRGEQSLLIAFVFNLLVIDLLWIELGYLTIYRMNIFSSFFGYAVSIYLTIPFLIIAPWQVIGIIRTCWRYFRNREFVLPVITLSFVLGLVCLSFFLIPPLWDMSKKAIERSNSSHSITSTNMIDEDAVRLVNDGRYILLQSEIREGLNEKLCELIEQHPEVEDLIIVTPGGYAKEAFSIAETIQNHQLNTYAIRECGSAGTILFAAGKKRILANTGVLSFHQTSNPYRTIYDMQHKIADRVLASFYRKHGISDEFIKRALKTPNDDIWKPSHDELLKGNVIDEVVETETILNGPHGTITELLNPEFFENNYYQAAIRRFPDEFWESAKILDTVYANSSQKDEVLKRFHAAHNQLRIMAMVNTSPGAAREYMEVYASILAMLLENDVKTAIRFFRPEVYGLLDIQEHVSDELREQYINAETRLFSEEPETPLVLSEEAAREVLVRVYGHMAPTDYEHLDFMQDMTIEEERQHVEAWIAFYQTVLEHFPGDANKVLHALYRGALEEETDTALP